MVYRRQDTQGHDTAVIISMLVLEATTRSRWIRCGRCKKSQKLQDAQTKVQSDNLILRISLRLTKRIEDGMGGEFEFRPDVILRTAAEVRDVIVRTLDMVPFIARELFASNRGQLRRGRRGGRGHANSSRRHGRRGCFAPGQRGEHRWG